MIPPAPHNNTILVLRRAFTASRQRVFRAWIEPEALEYWLRPRGMGVTVSKLDARVGGSSRFDELCVGLKAFLKAADEL